MKKYFTHIFSVEFHTWISQNW